MNSEQPRNLGVPAVEIAGLGVFLGQQCEGVYQNHELALDTNGWPITYSIIPDADWHYSATTVQAYAHAIEHIRRTFTTTLSNSLPRLRRLLHRYRRYSTCIPDESGISDEQLQCAININRIHVRSNTACLMGGNVASLIETYDLDIQVNHRGRVVSVSFDG